MFLNQEKNITPSPIHQQTLNDDYSSIPLYHYSYSSISLVIHLYH